MNVKNIILSRFYFSKEKEIPNEYLDIIYIEEEELLKAINSYNNQI